MRICAALQWQILTEKTPEIPAHSVRSAGMIMTNVSIIRFCLPMPAFRLEVGTSFLLQVKIQKKKYRGFANMEMTIKQLAGELNVSKSTVSRAIVQLGFQNKLRRAGNKYLLSDTQILLIKQQISKNDTEKTLQEEAESHHATEKSLQGGKLNRFTLRKNRFRGKLNRFTLRKKRFKRKIKQ